MRNQALADWRPLTRSFFNMGQPRHLFIYFSFFSPSGIELGSHGLESAALSTRPPRPRLDKKFAAWIFKTRGSLYRTCTQWLCLQLWKPHRAQYFGEKRVYLSGRPAIHFGLFEANRALEVFALRQSLLEKLKQLFFRAIKSSATRINDCIVMKSLVEKYDSVDEMYLWKAPA